MNKKQMNTGLVVFICCVLVAIGVTLHLRKHDMLPIIHKVVDNTTATLVADTVKKKKPVVKRCGWRYRERWLQMCEDRFPRKI